MISFVVGFFVLCLAGQAALWATSCRAHPPIDGLRYPPEAILQGQYGDVVIESPFIRINDERVSRLDLEAAGTLSVNSVVVLVLFVPSVISVSFLYHCIDSEISSEIEFEQCTSKVQTFFYTRELISFPCAFFSPLYFAFLSQDIRSVLLRQ